MLAHKHGSLCLLIEGSTWNRWTNVNYVDSGTSKEVINGPWSYHYFWGKSDALGNSYVIGDSHFVIIIFGKWPGGTRQCKDLEIRDGPKGKKPVWLTECEKGSDVWKGWKVRLGPGYKGLPIQSSAALHQRGSFIFLKKRIYWFVLTKLWEPCWSSQICIQVQIILSSLSYRDGLNNYIKKHKLNFSFYCSKIFTSPKGIP